MDHLTPHYFHDGYREVKDAKGAVRFVPGTYTIRPQHVGVHDDQDDQLSVPNTPSMTRGSSRSTSSSMSTCESCEMHSQSCACHSDSDGIRFLQSENGSIRSRTQSPATCQSMEKLRAHKSFLPTHLHLSPLNAMSKPSPIPQSGPLGSRFLRDGPKSIFQTESSESEMSEESSEEPEDSHEEDDEWSGQDDDLEMIVLEALGGDLELAAHLIPVLHKSFHSDMVSSVTQKVGPWRNGITKCSPGGEETSNGQTSSSNAQSPTNPRKRQRRQGSAGQSRETEDDDEEEDDDPGDPKGMGDSPQGGGPSEVPRLACPFHKRLPTKYCIQHSSVDNAKRTDYRSCEGPGFKSIQRLKEHLKRKHYPVQCDRCYEIFPGSDRAACVLALEEHRQLQVPCERRRSDLREGISDAQWASLDKKKSSKKSYASSRVDKYWEIWDTLFPGITRPKTPWYDGKKSSKVVTPFPEGTRHFSELFTHMLELQVKDQQIRFPEGMEQIMMQKLIILAQKSFNLSMSLKASSSTDSSSTRSRPQNSLLSGSYQQISTPRTSEGPYSASRSIAGQSQAYSADFQNSPSGHRTSRSSMGPPFMNMQPLQQPSYVQDSLQTTLPQHPAHPQFMSSMPSFPHNAFASNMDNSNWYGMAFDGASPGFATNGASTGFVNLQGGALNTGLISSNEAGAQGLGAPWEHLQNPRMHYNGRQQ